MPDKIYVGDGKLKTFEWGNVLNVTLDLDSLIEEFNNHGYVAKNGRRKVRVTVARKKEPGQYGDTHYITLDQWHPDHYQKPAPISISEGKMFETPEIKDDEEIPF